VKSEETQPLNYILTNAKRQTTSVLTMRLCTNMSLLNVHEEQDIFPEEALSPELPK
jgi:hypothetical protein